MRQFDKIALLEEELHDLRLRLDLCEADKKAYVETTQWTLKQNKDEMNKLRVNNKNLAEEVSSIKKYDTGGGDKRIDIISKLEQRTLDLQKKLDDLKSGLKTKIDRFNLAQINLESVDSPEQVSDDNRQEITNLENKLDKVQIRFNEATTIRKVYEQIIKALNEERTQFDQQLIAFERSLKQKRVDAQDLEQMAQDAQRARDTARGELQKFEVKLLEERKQREKEIQRLKEIIRLRRLNDERSDRKGRTVDEHMDDFYDQQSARDPNIDQKVGDMEKTLKKVKDATGVSQLSELLQKLRTFQQTNEQLSSLKSQYETKLADLREKRKSLQSYSASEVSLHESSIQEKQRDIAAMRKEMADKKSQLDQVNRLNSSVRLGLQQLFEKLQVVNVSDVVIDEDFRVQNDNVVDAIKICAQKITQLHKNLKAKEDAEGEIPLPSSTLTKAVLPAYNSRIKAIQTGRKIDDEDEDEPVNESNVLDRDTLKKYTAQMLNARIKNKQGKGKKKGRRADEEDD